MTEDQETPAPGTFSRLMSESTNEKKDRTNVPTDERTEQLSKNHSNVRTSGRTNQPSNEPSVPVHRIAIPATRHKVRWAFDIFQDQKKALDTLQFAAVENGDKKPTVAVMVQQALDAYIKQQSKRLDNVEVEVEEEG